MVKIPTTDGEKNEVSEIYAFKVTDPSSTKINSMDPLLLQIKEAIGENKYNSSCLMKEALLRGIFSVWRLFD